MRIIFHACLPAPVWNLLKGMDNVSFMSLSSESSTGLGRWSVNGMPNCFSCVWLFATPWTLAHQPLLSVGFYRQEYWSGLLFPSGDLLHTGIEPTSLKSPALAGGFFTTSTTWEALKLPQSATFSHSHGCCMTCLSSSQEHWYLCALPRFLPAFLSFRSQFKCHLILWRA